MSSARSFPRRGDRLEGVALPARAIQRQGVERPQPLPVGMLGDGRLQLGYHLTVLTQRETCVGAVLYGVRSQRVEPCGDGVDPVLSSELRERWSRPGAEGVVQDIGSARRVTFGEGCLPGRHQILEAGRIDGGAVDRQAVARRPGEQDAGRLAGPASGFEHPAQVRDVCLQRGIGVRRQSFAPDQVGQPLRRDGTAQLDQQCGQHGALLAAAEIELLIAVGYPQASEDAVLQAPFLPQRVPRTCGARGGYQRNRAKRTCSAHKASHHDRAGGYPALNRGGQRRPTFNGEAPAPPRSHRAGGPRQCQTFLDGRPRLSGMPAASGSSPTPRAARAAPSSRPRSRGSPA